MCIVVERMSHVAGTVFFFVDRLPMFLDLVDVLLEVSHGEVLPVASVLADHRTGS